MAQYQYPARPAELTVHDDLAAPTGGGLRPLPAQAADPARAAGDHADRHPVGGLRRKALIAQDFQAPTGPAQDR